MLPLAGREFEFLEQLNGEGEIEPSLLTVDEALQRRIDANPGLRWKAQKGLMRKTLSNPRHRQTRSRIPGLKVR